MSIATSAVGCSAVPPAPGPLFNGAEAGSLCGPVSTYRDASISQPIEWDGEGAVDVSRVAVSHLVNVRVSRASVGALQSAALLGPVTGTIAPTWRDYGKTFVVTHSHPGQAVAVLHVIDPTKNASAGPFSITYRVGGKDYQADAVLDYKVAASRCN